MSDCTADEPWPGPLGVVVGAGALPGLVAAAALSHGREVLLIGIEGQPAAFPRGFQSVTIRLERLAACLDALRARGVQEVVMVGKLHRPTLNLGQADLRTLAMAARIVPLFSQGDDALLRGILRMVEAEGFAVRGIDQIAPQLMAGAGPLGRVQPGPGDMDDARRAAAIVAALGALDIGQAAVVAQGLCLGVEALPGTDALLRAVAAIPSPIRPDPAAGRGVLYKGPKPGQELRSDPPAIGPETVALAAAAGLAGIAVAAGEAVMIDRDATVRAADAAGLFVLGLA